MLKACNGESMEVPSPVFSTKIIDIRYSLASLTEFTFAVPNGSTSSILIMPGEDTITWNLASAGLEIPGQAHFYVCPNGEQYGEKDYIQITYIG